MNNRTDHQLLAAYAAQRSEAAFAELVRRHVDLVHSAALRLVRDAHAAQDVTQGVFLALAQNARQLTDRPALEGWLHGTTRNLAANAVRSDLRRRAREQEATLMNELLSADPDTRWEHIAPHLDEALGELDEPDRDALLLRYFKNHDLRTVGATLGISDDAAQKRVSRAVERLREFFAKRGLTVGAGGLVVVISANAVQAAPVGLAVTISTAAALAGTTLATTATATATKAIAMTTIQKTLIAATLAAAVGTGIYEARKASQLRDQVITLLQQQAPLGEQIQQLNRERDEAKRQLAVLHENNEQLNRNKSELLRLRAELTRIRTEAAPARSPDILDQSANGQKTLDLPILSRSEFSGMTINANVPWSRVLLSGGWKMPSGNRAVVFAVPTQLNADDKSQLQLSSRIVEFPDAAASAIGLENFIYEAPEAHQPSLVTPEELETILKAARSAEGVVIHDLGSVTTLSGRQAQLMKATKDGDSLVLGPIIDLLPRISSDGQSVDLRILPQFAPATQSQR